MQLTLSSPMIWLASQVIDFTSYYAAGRNLFTQQAFVDKLWQ